MAVRTVILGDDLDALHELSARGGETGTGEPGRGASPPRATRAVVVGLDLRDTTSLRDAKKHLKDALRHTVDDVRRYSTLVHLCVAYLAPAGISADRLSTAADRVASRLHATLERQTGQYVDVTLLDVTKCADSTLLAERIEQRIGEKAGAHSEVALTWSDIEHRSIARATMDQYL